MRIVLAFLLVVLPQSLESELPEKIQVLAIAHARRKPGYWKQRV